MSKKQFEEASQVVNELTEVIDFESCRQRNYYNKMEDRYKFILNYVSEMIQGTNLRSWCRALPTSSCISGT